MHGRFLGSTLCLTGRNQQDKNFPGTTGNLYLPYTWCKSPWIPSTAQVKVSKVWDQCSTFDFRADPSGGKKVPRPTSRAGTSTYHFSTSRPVRTGGCWSLGKSEIVCPERQIPMAEQQS